MLKLSISGKANSGKNTASKIICEEFSKKYNNFTYLNIAFANPIKAMIRLMFPNLPEHFITGPSHFRKEIIPNAFDKNGRPLTIRQLHIDLGTMLGRGYNKDIWLTPFDLSFQKAEKELYNLLIVSDCRMQNEFDHLKKLKFYQIRLLRSGILLSKDITETEQENIKDEEFNFILNNNGSLDDLRKEIVKIIDQIND